MLNILCSYLQNAPDPSVQLCLLFNGLVEQHTLDIIRTIKWKTDGIALDAKFWLLLERINHTKQLIYSEIVDTMLFGAAVQISYQVISDKIDYSTNSIIKF